MELKVHRFSKCIFRHEFGDGPVVITRESIIAPCLQVDPVRVKNATLTATVTLTGPNELISRVHPDSGFSIYRIHLSRMLDWLYHHHITGGQPYSALKEYYDMYDIGEDDLSLETAYKQWQRWAAKKNSPKKLYPAPATVLNNTTKPEKCTIEAIAAHLNHHHAHLYTGTGAPSLPAFRRLVAGFLAQAGYTQKVIADSLGISQQMVSRALVSYYTDTHSR